MIRPHESANTDVTANRDLNVRHRFRQESKAYVDTLVTESCENLASGGHGDIKLKGRMAAAKFRQQRRQEGKPDAFHRRNAHGARFQATEHVEFGYSRLQGRNEALNVTEENFSGSRQLQPATGPYRTATFPARLRVV
jgi:hypothetical protein